MGLFSSGGQPPPYVHPQSQSQKGRVPQAREQTREAGGQETFFGSPLRALPHRLPLSLH